MISDPPLPLTSKKPLTSSQLQRLANLRGAASLSVALPFGYYKRSEPQQPVLKKDLETIIARDQDLQELIQGLVAPATRPPLTLKQRHKAFDNYLRLVYGSDLMVGMKSGPGSARTFTLSDTSLLFFPVPGHKPGKGIPAVGHFSPFHREGVIGPGEPAWTCHDCRAGCI